MSDNLFKRTGSADFPMHLKVMVSGPPKSGKTSLLGTMPGILVLDTEPHANNLESIAHLDVPYATITNSDDLRQAAMILGQDSLRKQLAQQYGMSDIKGVAIDTLDSLQKVLKAERLREQKSTQFLRDDWGWLKTEMEAIVEMFTALPLHVFFMVHTKTKEMGRGDDAYTVTLPGLEGSIAESIAGMVGYSLLSFRKEEITPEGKPITKYWLRTEGDGTHDFLGTRTAGRLPTIIEPNIKTIYDAVMAGRAKAQQKNAAPAPAAPPANPIQAVAQSAGQESTPVETPTPAPQTETATSPAPGATPTTDSPAPSATPASTPSPDSAETQTAAPAPATEQIQTPVAEPAPTPPAEKTDGEDPVSPAALGHVKRVYDGLEVLFPQDKLEAELKMKDARQIVQMWRALIQDHNEGKGGVGTSPQTEMLEYLGNMGWLGDPADYEKKEAPVADPAGTIEQVKAYIGNPPDLAKVQEVYDLETAKGDGARSSLITKLESLGAKPAAAPEVQTPVETSTPAAPAEDAATGVDSEAAGVDTSATEEEAVKAVEEKLGGVTIEQGINPEAKCDVCGKTIDDLDLADLGKKRFDKMLCVEDYLAELKK